MKMADVFESNDNKGENTTSTPQMKHSRVLPYQEGHRIIMSFVIYLKNLSVYYDNDYTLRPSISTLILKRAIS